LGKSEDYKYFLKSSYNYRNLFNPETDFFHPKDSKGNFIQPFDYKFSGGQGARGFYGENNAWTYRWDVQHNIADLINLMGGREIFLANLNATFVEPLGKSKFEFYAQLPDHTGNVGQFSMANEPSLHIPYLYNYAGQPWKTQKMIRTLLAEWFRNDLMGVPGDEDGGLIHAIGAQVGSRSRCWRKVQLGQPRGQHPVKLLRKGLPEIAGAQPGLHMADSHALIKRRQSAAKRGGGVALHQHQVRPPSGKNGFQGSDHPRRQLRERLVGPHEVQVIIGLNLEHGQDLVKHLPVLRGDTDFDLKLIRPGVHVEHNRTELDRLRPRTEDEQNTLAAVF